MALSEAVAALLGAVLGGAASLGGTVIEQRRQEAAERAARGIALDAERKAAYLRLLTAARRLRYQARLVPRHDPVLVDGLRTDLSAADYEVALIARPDMATKARALRRSTLDYLNAAVDAAAAGEDGSGPRVQGARMTARSAVRGFLDAARTDLGIARTAQDLLEDPDAPGD